MLGSENSYAFKTSQLAARSLVDVRKTRYTGLLPGTQRSLRAAGQTA